MPKSHNKTGRSKSRERYSIVPHSLLESFAWSCLSANGKVAWLEFCRTHNGTNNGRIAVSVRVLGARLGVVPDTAARAIRELVTYGFLEITRGASFSGKRRATEYRLTHLKDDVTGEPPSRAFQNIGKASDYNGHALAKTVSDPSDNIDLNSRTSLVRPIGRGSRFLSDPSDCKPAKLKAHSPTHRRSLGLAVVFRLLARKNAHYLNCGADHVGWATLAFRAFRHKVPHKQEAPA
jgi:hypothetical protein